MTGARGSDEIVEFGKPPRDTPLGSGAFLKFAKNAANLEVDGVAGLARNMPVVNRLHDLFDAKRNQHAQHDDPHLARELSPAVQRFG